MTRDRAASDVAITDDDRARAGEQLRRSTRGVIPISLGLQTIVQLLAGLLVTTQVSGLEGMALVAATAVLSVAILTPVVYVFSAGATRRSEVQLADSLAKERVMRLEVSRREFETRLANALEMAEAEPEAMAAAGRALRSVAPGQRIEILLADNSHAHLERALVTGDDPDGPGCGVESPDRCVASRRGQTQVFADSDNLDACPKLQDRAYGRCSAVCVPVSIMGRTVGVVHLAVPVAEKVAEPPVEQLEVLANQVGARLGMLRVMTETRVQATTDSLTGLPNRRSFESRVRLLRQAGTQFSLVMADLDNFKVLNDTHGHELGDRALRVFSNLLRASLRPVDISCRYGGEEFTVVLPGCSPAEAVQVCERLRETLALATQVGSAPEFTASFGIAPSSDELTLEEITANADLALYEAKRSGRNRAVVFDGTRMQRRNAQAPVLLRAESQAGAPAEELVSPQTG
jgi:diguanylate cyclase (GGDEF)-like protein